jgi:predicted helicase
MYDWNRSTLAQRADEFVNVYNSEVDRYIRTGYEKNVDSFVNYDRVKWSRDLKLDLKRGNYAEFKPEKLRQCTCRPFSKRYLFFDRIFNEDVYQFPHFMPSEAA